MKFPLNTKNVCKYSGHEILALSVSLWMDGVSISQSLVLVAGFYCVLGGTVCRLMMSTRDDRHLIYGTGRDGERTR